MTNIISHKEKLLKKISFFLKRKNLKNILQGGIQAFSIIIICFLLLSIVESINYFSTSIRLTFIIVLLLVAIILLTIFIATSVWNYFNSRSLLEIDKGAQEIGAHYSEVKDNLLNSLQLFENKNNNFSPELANAAFENTYNKVSQLDFFEILNYSELKKKIKILTAILVITAITLISFPLLRQGSLRLLNFNKEFAKPLEFSLEVLTGNKKIKKGESIFISVKSMGKTPEDIFISTKSSIESEYKDHLVKSDSNNIFTIELRSNKNSMVYFAQKNEIKTGIYRIEVTSPPIISMINFDLIPPQYSRLPIITQDNNGNISALKGTKVNYKLTTTKDLNSAVRKYDINKIDSLAVDNKSTDGSFNVIKNGIYFFEILDKDGNKNENPIQYSIKVSPDRFPEIEILKPERISLLPSNDIVSINYTIKDDFGFSKTFLRYSRFTTEQQSEVKNIKNIELKISPNKVEQALYYNWDVSRLGLKENEIVTYYIEVYDNDFVSGPKSTKSEIYKLRVPTLDELFAQADNVQESAMDDLTETLQESQELQKELQQISDELKQNEKEIDWNEKERIEETVKKFEEIANKIDDVQEQLENMRKEMTENNLLSEETMEKYNELQDLMDELSSEEMRKAMEDMQKSLEQLMRDKVQQSMENLSMNEELFQKSIERTLNLLKKIQIEQKMDEVIKRTEKMVEDLEKLTEETEKNLNEENQSENQELANEQKDVDNQINSLEDELQKLQEKMSEVNDMPIQKMEELKKQFDEQKNQELSENAMEKLEKQNPFDALKDQQQLSKNMSSMQKQLQQMQQQMQQQSQQMVMQNMLKAIDNIIGLSKEQESLNKETNQLRSQPRQLPNMAQPQMEIKQNLENILKQLSELSQKTFAITPEMGEALGKARNNMNQSIAGMQKKNGQQVSSKQGEAMKSLNEAAEFLQNSLQSMMQGGGQGSGGMMSMMQQLQQMAQQQMGLNKMTQMMKQGQLTMQQQAQLQRLSQEQGAIKKSLSELNKEAREAGESKKLTINLEKVLEEMNEVISGLNTKKVDDDLIRTQEKILSKLLDAQRSINERDFEKNRESFSGKVFNLESPNELILSDERAKDILREELLKSIQEGYSKDYEDLIRRYFESLNNSTNKN